MRQGTTPTHTFSIPVEAALVDSIYICYSQRGCGMLEKTKPQVTLADDEDGGHYASVSLTQEETLSFKAGIECLIQVRFTTVSGEAFASQIISESVDGVIKGGEI